MIGSCGCVGRDLRGGPSQAFSLGDRERLLQTLTELLSGASTFFSNENLPIFYTGHILGSPFQEWDKGRSLAQGPTINRWP